MLLVLLDLCPCHSWTPEIQDENGVKEYEYVDEDEEGCEDDDVDEEASEVEGLGGSHCWKHLGQPCGNFLDDYQIAPFREDPSKK